MKINIELTNEEVLDPAIRGALLCILAEAAPESEDIAAVTEPPAPVTEQPTPVTEQPALVTEQPALVTEPAAVPTAPPAFTRDELALAATQLMDQGKMPELQKVLAAMGVKALTELSEDRFAAFAAAIRKLGAKI